MHKSQRVPVATFFFDLRASTAVAEEANTAASVLDLLITYHQRLHKHIFEGGRIGVHKVSRQGASGHSACSRRGLCKFVDGDKRVERKHAESRTVNIERAEKLHG